LARTVGGNAASLELFDKKTLRHREMYSYGLPRAEELQYIEHYAPLNIRLPFVSRQKLHDLSWDHLILNEAAMRASPFYEEFMPRMDVRYFVSGIVLATDSEFAGVCVHRSAKMGHIQRDGIALMRQLAPHVRQAFDVARRLRGANEARHSLERALDWLADGVALVRADGAIVYVNEALQAIARQYDGITIREGAFEFAAADIRARFDAAVGSVGRLRGGQLRTESMADFHMPRRSGAPPYLVSVRPLLDRKHADNGAVAIVFVRDPTRRYAAALHVLREALGLTEAEAALAQALQSGMSLTDYAKVGGVSLNTVYTHLRRIKEKTGCHRMAELIRKLNDLQVPLRVD
jgi:DNA-binding CsgD family transcriptional regulator